MAETRETFFELPSDPEQFGVFLPPADLRTIDYSALEYHPLIRAFVEYLKTYFPDQFNDFTPQSLVMVLAELLAYGAANAALHADVLANEAFLPTARTREAVAQHLKLIDRPLKQQTPANVDISVRLNSPAPTTIKIPAGEKFSVTGPDGDAVVYELYRAPGDFSSSVEIPPGSVGVIAVGIEGQFADPLVAISDGATRQSIRIANASLLTDPITVDVSGGGEEVRWKRIDAIERAGPNDEVYEVRFFDGGAEVVFGDNLNGKAPVSGQEITIRYRFGGGIRGRIGPAVINESRQVRPESPATGFVNVTFRNLEPSSGGTDAESMDVAKRVAPKEAAALKSATTGEDYAVLAKNFRHPVFGAVLKAVATARTELNANLVELHVLAEGPGGVPVTPSAGLKRGLEAFFGPIMVLTDELRVVDASFKTVNLEMQVVVARSADQSIVIDKVESAVDDFFDISNRDLGEGMYVAALYEKIQKIDGVRLVNIHSPSDNLYPVERNSPVTQNTVQFNELIVLGSKKIDYFSERDTR